MFVIALLGGIGRVGGWVLEASLEKGYVVRALARSPLKLADHVARYPETLVIVEWSSARKIELTPPPPFNQCYRLCFNLSTLLCC